MRAGDVIPQVVSPTAKAQKRKGRERRPEPPAQCPACGTPTVKPEGGVWTICPNRASLPGPGLPGGQALRGARWTSTAWARRTSAASSTRG